MTKKDQQKVKAFLRRARLMDDFELLDMAKNMLRRAAQMLGLQSGRKMEVTIASCTLIATAIEEKLRVIDQAAEEQMADLDRRPVKKIRRMVYDPSIPPGMHGVCYNCLNGGHTICERPCACSKKKHQAWWWRPEAACPRHGPVEESHRCRDFDGVHAGGIV